MFCPEGRSPWDTVSWEERTAQIQDASGKVLFEQKGVEVPSHWSQIATNVVVSKYFRGHLGSSERETSVRQLIGRVVDTITGWGIQDAYFADEQSEDAFRADLAWLCLHQHLSFNSPVWFNVGVEQEPQCSACFINSVEDTMESILNLAKVEGMLFKWGSGTGTNLSSLRASTEKLARGGQPSGPVSFMRGFDAFAGVIKSGGKTRRAAKMVILDMDHPDIREFINCKADEEKKAWALIGAGYDSGFNVPGGAYDSVFFQNSNNSVRASDAFMQACVNDGLWKTHAITTNEVMATYRARDLLSDIAEAAWICGDPGMQFDSTINNWNTCLDTERIRASNPCSEYMFMDDSACNLASLNLMRFRTEDGTFEPDRFRAAVRRAITAQEIIVNRSSYPTERITRNSRKYRPLGLGYANLGALLMAAGLPYDSHQGRQYAAAVTALMQAEAYRWSAKIASHKGPFDAYSRNRGSMLRVIVKHVDAARSLDQSVVPNHLYQVVQEVWSDCEALGRRHGFRNAQVTVLAPTGTIGFMMDCDTTGIEPDIALIKYKKLVGGGMMKIVNSTVAEALARLGYSPVQQIAIAAYLETHETIEGAPDLVDEHLPVFDCAFKPRNGSRSITPLGHIKMMAAVQPHLSGAISKTVNVPEYYTPKQIADIYLEAWKQGLKAVAVYRDGCKRSQPLNTGEASSEAKESKYHPVRHKLPSERKAITHKFSVGGHEGYVTVGMYDDGSPGEIFIVMAKEGSVVSGLMDGFATSVSLALQYGVPLQVLCDKFTHTRFEPSGYTGNQEIPIAKSVLDYIFRWLELRFMKSTTEDSPDDSSAEPSSGNSDAPDLWSARSAPDAQVSISDHYATGNAGQEAAARASRGKEERQVYISQADAPPCQVCGNIMVRSGTCYKCFNCGASSGCS